MDRKALIGLLSGITMVIATLLVVAVLNTRAAEGAGSIVRAEAHDCARGAKPAEPGYSVLPANELCARAY